MHTRFSCFHDKLITG